MRLPRIVPIGLLCTPLVALLWWSPPHAASREPGESGQPRRPTRPIPTRGVAIQISNGIDALDVYSRLIGEVAALGANTVLLSPCGFMEHARSQSITIDARRTPAKAEFVRLIEQAHGRGLRVILMPTVLLSHPRGSEWRGVIEPPDWREWWEQYREFLRYFCDVAREGQVEILMVGSELVSTEKQLDEWLETIELARTLFPGKLGYSANWDHYRPVRFWDKLDVIGMTSYYTLADQKNPTVEQIAAAWAPIRDEILAWQKSVAKPLILTEVGWCSQEGAAMAPWNYYQNMKATPAGLEEQRRLYEGFLRAWDGAEGLAGVIWWEWTTADGGPTDFNYTPRGKPAELVLRRWFAAQSEQELAAASRPAVPGSLTP